MGGAPKPTRLKILEGNPGKRALNYREPKPKHGTTMPAYLDKQARLEWRRVAPELNRLGLLTIVDRTALAAYCDAVSHMLAARKVLKEQGMSYECNDYVRARPEVGIYHKCQAIIKSWCQEFGFTPSARTRLTMGAEQEDDLDALLR